MSDHATPYLYTREDGEVRWMGETSTRFLTINAPYALVEEQAKRGVSVPLHKHDEDVEAFYVLEGEIQFYLGDQPGVRAPAGAFALVPGGKIHGFRIASETARYLILTTPRHAQFYRAITSSVPHAAIDGQVVETACQEYGIEFVGPLPD